MLLLEYGAGIEVPFVYRLSPPAPYFACAFLRSAVLSARAWMALITVVTFGAFGFFVF